MPVLPAPRSPLARRHPPLKGPPFSEEYVERQRRLVADALADEELAERFRRRAPLPRGLGAGFDERVVELPWVLARAPRGRVLDAGSALNHPHVLERLLPEVDSLLCVTASADEKRHDGVEYARADLRDLHFEDASFETVVCLSTLEHIGMDNSIYGIEADRATDPQGETLAALGELRRVASPGGRLLLSVPYGRREDHGWFRQLDAAEVKQLAAAAAAGAAAIDVYRYSRRGWHVSDLEGAARARYHDHRAEPGVARDRAAAARAVACLELGL